ncbi:GNAT family N-acetyltransferase [Streptomyces tubbatahanensis]|uniref:GNAT family N-acetyltransferase n=1 Tax=Streptomyces tubbatahanensis TaxID=2923272 RepID=A0ABY3XRH5_9ACTN|nr:GNAT family N-acetyltransferase [Streptomyces tubbatahanensis]UNS97017.1 GNAT family N-acetyltransferase [Streptomyces tubbatahanensis]
MTTEPRVLQPSEWGAWYERVLSAFAGEETPEEHALYRSLTEIERCLGVWDEGRPVATAGLLSFRMAVPGGAVVPTAGVTMVSVAPTHRRRGILRSFMRRQLDDIRAAGEEPLAVLTASEAAIYGRFGYGLAAGRMAARIDTSRSTLSLPAPLAAEADGLELRASDTASALLAECEAVYARAVPLRPGMLERRPGWEHAPLLDPERRRGGASPLRCVVALRDGTPVAFARYAVKLGASASGAPEGEVRLQNLEAVDAAGHAAMWRFLWSLDLTTSIVTDNRPVDDPWLYLVDDPRRSVKHLNDDTLYARLVEVGDALAARSYGAPLDVVLEVEDTFCPWNSGRWRLSGDEKGAVCRPTRDAADLSLSVRELGRAYLGGVSLAALGSAGLVREVRPGSGALRAAATAFTSETAPWLPHGF